MLVLAALLGTLAVGVTACGGSDSASGGGTTTEEHASPAEAREKVETIRGLLDEAVTTYKGGDHKVAADAVGDIYLEHYEDVEGPLGERNHDLMEELEEQISTDLRQAMEAGKPDTEIDALVAEIKENLEQAKQELA